MSTLPLPTDDVALCLWGTHRLCQRTSCGCRCHKPKTLIENEEGAQLGNEMPPMAE